MQCKGLVVPTTVCSKMKNHRTEDVHINGSMENVSMTLGFKPEPSPLSASLTQQTGTDEILPSDRPISFLFLIIRHISALIDVYHRQMTFGLVCHYPMFASGKLSYFFPQKSYWSVIVLEWEGQIRFTSHVCCIHQLHFGCWVIVSLKSTWKHCIEEILFQFLLSLLRRFILEFTKCTLYGYRSIHCVPLLLVQHHSLAVSLALHSVAYSSIYLSHQHWPSL